jgi:hypothetical protein
VNVIAIKVGPINRPRSRTTNPPKNAEDCQRHRPGNAKADQPRLDEIVNRVDEYGLDDHEHSPGLLILPNGHQPAPPLIRIRSGPPTWPVASSGPIKPSMVGARRAGDRRTDNELDRLTALPMPWRLPPCVSPVRRSSTKFSIGQKALRNSVDSAKAGVFCAAQQACSAVVCPLISRGPGAPGPLLSVMWAASSQNCKIKGRFYQPRFIAERLT